MYNKERLYICTANCIELDIDNKRHCSCIVRSDEALLDMYRAKCPCENTPIWTLEEECKDNE